MQTKLRDQPNKFIKAELLEPRAYQTRIAEACLHKKSLVVIPTGLGKVIIAILLAAKTLKQAPDGSKVFVMPPTRPLIHQHFESFQKFLVVLMMIFAF